MSIAGWFTPEISVEQVLTDKPFSGFITITKIEPFYAGNALSGRTFFIDTDKGRFKLRACHDEKQAEDIEANMRRFQHIFPKFYGRDRNYILMEALEGYRNMTAEELRERAHQIGRIYGEIAKTEELREHDDEKFFRRRLGQIRDTGVIDEILYRNILAAYESSRKSIEVKVGLDLNDVHEGNFMVDEKGAMLYVDEEGISHRMKGLGIGKVLKKLKHEDEWDEFLRGYNEMDDGSYLTPEYIRHIRIVEAVRSISFKMNRREEKLQRNMREELEQLKRLVG